MIKIYGHSDDVVCLVGDHEQLPEELGAFDLARTITIGGEGEGLEVVAEYHGVWQFALRQIDEDVPVPWPIRIETEHGYSLAVVIDCPRDTPISFDEEED